MRSIRNTVVVFAVVALVASCAIAASPAPVRPELRQKMDSAVKFYNDKQYDKAASALDEILRMTPSSREALDLQEKAGIGNLLKMLAEPAVGQKVRLLLQKASEEAQRMNRDPAAIQALIEKTTSADISQRWAAIRQLTVIGPFAAPQLLDVALSDEPPIEGSKKAASLIVLRSMSEDAVEQLLVALRYGGDETAAKIMPFLEQSRDVRAIPPLKAIAEDDSKPEYLRNVAKATLNMFSSVKPSPGESVQKSERTIAISSLLSMTAAEGYFTLAGRYYHHEQMLLALTPAPEQVLWKWNPSGNNFSEKLVYQTASPFEFAHALAADCILEGMKAKHSSPEFLALCICNSFVVLSQEQASAKPSYALTPLECESLGAEYLYLALGRALDEKTTSLAARCADALYNVGDSRPPKANMLVNALRYPDKTVQVSAAIALMKLNPLGSLPAAAEKEVSAVLARALGAPVKSNAAILTADATLYRMLSKAIEAVGMLPQLEKSNGEALQHLRDSSKAVSVLVIDVRSVGDRPTALIDAIRASPRTAKLPVMMLAKSGDIEKLRSNSGTAGITIVPLATDPGQVAKMAQAAAGPSSSLPADQLIRENVATVRRVLQSLIELPADANYPKQEIAAALVSFLSGGADEIRSLALRAAGNLRQPGLRDPVLDIFADSREPANIRQEAGVALVKLLVVNPKIDPQQQSLLLTSAGDADENVRSIAMHALSIAAIPQQAREARIIGRGSPILIESSGAPEFKIAALEDLVIREGMPELYLASSSPRRKELLLKLGRPFRVISPDVDETFDPAVSAIDAAKELALRKATWAATKIADGTILAADTLVSAQDEIIGKPRNREDAIRILRLLSSAPHSVITGVCLLDAKTGRKEIDSAETIVTMRRMSEQEILSYVDSGEAMGKAGAYAIQETGDKFIESVKGSLSNVVGLPLELVERMLKKFSCELQAGGV